MALIHCPTCWNEVSESASGCPKCGQMLTAENVSIQKKIENQMAVQAEEDVKRWFMYACGIAVLFLAYVLVFPGELEQDIEQPKTRDGSTVSSYAENLRRHNELGRTTFPNHKKISDFVDLDARLSVQEGLMTIEQYEKWTGKKY